MILLVLAAIAITLLSGVATLILRGRAAGALVGVVGTMAACLLGLFPTARVLLGGPTRELSVPWSVPGGSFAVGIDPISAFFLLPTFGLSALAALFGLGYLGARERKHATGAFWFFFNLLVASMVMVLIARNGVLFLLAWETMSLASYFLVVFEDDREEVRRAGWIYLVATHLGTGFLLVLFPILSGPSGGLEFGLGAPSSLTPMVAGVCFLLAILGFGTKAGFMPLHAWLPEAHPAAPSHVSALMSGVMIKTGIYGIVRVMSLLGHPEPWWGWLLVGIGASSGVLGVVFALAQHDLKRLLAYHSVENIGIICLGLGVGVLGLASGVPAVAVLGFGGGLLHVLNHALFKGLLFLGAGSVIHATGTSEIDRLGGLLKRMPWTAGAFFVGSVAICGLPPLNGFISEFLIFLSAFQGGAKLTPSVAVPLIGVVSALALIGGLAVACFTKAFGIVFLGEPRSDRPARPHDPGFTMMIPMLALGAGCVVVGLLAPAVVGAMGPLLSRVTQLPGGDVERILADASLSVTPLAIVGFLLLALVAIVAGARRLLLRGREIARSGTWDCGYASPSTRMQYSASSFAQPLTSLFQPLLRTRRQESSPKGIFPRDATLRTETPDVFLETVYAPFFALVLRCVSRFRRVQHGRVQLYVLYIALTLFALLVWGMGGSP